ncbi:MAG: peptide chain release factor N(5)-glutamine methyltransferase [Patescibacteria group bacterium]
MTICPILTNNTNKLKKKRIPNPHLEAEFLLSHILKKPREFILAHPEKKLTKTQIKNYQLLITRRLKGEPLAYIICCKQFYGLDLYVNKNVLIPRPETELMVDEALKFATCNPKHAIIIDVGTGSGCVIISIAKKLSFGYPKLSFKYLASDISKSALAVARKNAKLHKVDRKIEFIQGNLLKPLLNILEIRNYNLVILANLPYLSPIQIKNSPTIKYEPKLALSAGPDGLKYYRQLFKQIGQVANHQIQITILCEIDSSQTIKIKKLIKKELPQSKIQIKKDLSGLNRMVKINI